MTSVYYCIVGFRQIAVPEENITDWMEEDFVMKASEVYAIEITPMMGMYKGSPQLSLTLIPIKDVTFQYNMISVLREDDPVYKAVRSKITGIVH